MGTYDQMIFDNRYPGDFDNEKYLYSQPPKTPPEQLSNPDDDGNGLLGRRVYLESPSFDNKEEEDMYRFVPSRLTDRTSSIIGPTVPLRTGATLVNPFGYEPSADKTRSEIPYRQESKPVAPQRQLPNTLTNMPRGDPRDDPLLGPLLAELDAMSTQQKQLPTLPSSSSIYRRNSVPYEPNLVHPANSSQPNHALTHIANQTVSDALLEAELYDFLDPRDQQQRQTIPYSAPTINSSNYSQQQQQQQPTRPPKMDGTDIFMPSSYTTDPASFLSHFGPEDQLFQRPLLNNLGQSYIPNPRLPPTQQRVPSFDQTHTHLSPPLRTNYGPPHLPPNYNNEQLPPPQQRVPSFDQPHTHLFPPLRTNYGPPHLPPNYNNEQLPPPQQRVPSFDRTHMHLSPPLRTNYAPPHLPPNYNNEQIPPQQQRVPSYDQPHTHLSPPLRTNYGPPHLPVNYSNEQPPPFPSNQYHNNPFTEYQRPPPQHQYEEQIPRQANPVNNQEIFFTDQNDNQYEQKQSPMISHHSGDQDSKRQTMWNELQHTSAKAQGKNVKKHESPNRTKGASGLNNTWNDSNSHQSSPLIKSSQRPYHRPPPVSKPNHIEENLHHRSPARKYENSYSRRQDFHSGSVNEQESNIQTSQYSQRQSSLPVTVNLNTNENSQTGPLPASVTIPLDSHINRVGDKISVNIDLRLVDLQNPQQQTTNHPQWSNQDPLDRHIRKLERNIDQSLPTTNPPQRSPVIPNTGRYGKTSSGAGRGGYNPPVYGGDYFNYGDKDREEDSYLAKMNYMKKTPQFKPYTGRDYEQFKKNYGFGIGHLGHDFDNTTHKEKTEKLAKTRVYAQQIEARNKKKLSDPSHRTYSDTRLPTQVFKPPRSLGHIRTKNRREQLSGKSTHSSPAILSGIVPFIPARRPTEVLYRQPPPRQLPKIPQYEDNEIIEQFNTHQERDKVTTKSAGNPPPKRREQIVENNSRRINSIERLTQNRTNQQRLPASSDTKRRPVRFDKPPSLNEVTHPPPPPIQQPSNAEQSDNRFNDEKMVMEVIRQELNERPLKNNEELVVVEQ